MALLLNQLGYSKSTSSIPKGQGTTWRYPIKHTMRITQGAPRSLKEPQGGDNIFQAPKRLFTKVNENQNVASSFMKSDLYFVHPIVTSSNECHCKTLLVYFLPTL